MLEQAKLETKTIAKSPMLTKLFLCNNFVYNKAWYIIPSPSFLFQLTNSKTISWTYKDYFSCGGRIVIYIPVSEICGNVYHQQSQDFKQRTAKHKSDVKSPHSNTFRICLEHLRDHNKAEPFFKYFHSSIKRILCLKNITKNNTLLDGNFH